jgi:hypothetical protein
VGEIERRGVRKQGGWGDPQNPLWWARLRASHLEVGLEASEDRPLLHDFLLRGHGAGWRAREGVERGNVKSLPRGYRRRFLGQNEFN